jgi:hypothetical protein
VRCFSRFSLFFYYNIQHTHTINWRLIANGTLVAGVVRPLRVLLLLARAPNPQKYLMLYYYNCTVQYIQYVANAERDLYHTRPCWLTRLRDKFEVIWCYILESKCVCSIRSHKRGSILAGPCLHAQQPRLERR